MIKKILTNGEKVSSVNHLKQSPAENLADMLAGFFNPEQLSKGEIELICSQCLEIAVSVYELSAIAEVYFSILNDRIKAIEIYSQAKEAVISEDETYFLEELGKILDI